MKIFTNATVNTFITSRTYKCLKRIVYGVVILAATGIMDTGQAHGLLNFLEIVIRIYAGYLQQFYLVHLLKLPRNANDTEMFDVSYDLADDNNYTVADDTC